MIGYGFPYPITFFEDEYMKKLNVVIIGAGNRGATYADIMAKYPEKYQVVGVAEPIESRRNYIRDKFAIPENMCFTDYHPLFELGKVADVAVIATMDRLHFDPAMAAISLGYDLLLEKPISPEPEECEKISRAAKEKGVKVVVCHVLRYTDYFLTLKKLIDSGRIGKIMSINHEEDVGNVHQSHSFVRGNWGNSERSSCMLLQKSCHDMDILQWLIGAKPKKLQSFGTLSYFREENAPADAPERCTDGCPHLDTCPYNTIKIYYDDKDNTWFRTTCTRLADPTDEDVMNSLKTTQYGKCVFKCDNDVVDHQTVNMLFEGDVTVTFSMNAFNYGGRFTHIMGTKGEIKSKLASRTKIELFDFEKREGEDIPIEKASDGISGGHGGGDEGIILSLYKYVAEDIKTPSISEIDISADNHLIVFAAEEARHKNTVVDFGEFKKGLLK